jgi:hypothetical protein
MFRENPTYIVAGEIVRTSRTWAHSVSPLRRAWLQRISPQLAAELKPHGGGGEEKPVQRRKRDFTNSVKIGKEIFEIRLEKGKKKTVVLPWEKIYPVVSRGQAELLPHYRRLKAKLILGQRELGSGMRLSTLLRLVPRIRPEDVLEEIPEGNFVVPDDYRALKARLADLLKPSPMQKGRRRLGFLTLHCDGGNTGVYTYWFRSTRNYITALNESLYSLEILADERERDSDGEVNRIYRELAQELEEL